MQNNCKNVLTKSEKCAIISAYPTGTRTNKTNQKDQNTMTDTMKLYRLEKAIYRHAAAIGKAATPEQRARAEKAYDKAMQKYCDLSAKRCAESIEYEKRRAAEIEAASRPAPAAEPCGQLLLDLGVA